MSEKSTSIDRRIVGYSGRARIFLYLTVAFGFLATVIVVAQAWLLSDVVSRVFLDGENVSGVSPLLLGMLALAFGRAATLWSGDVLAQRSASHLKHQLRADLTRHIFNLGPVFTRRASSGELVNTAVQGVEDLDEYMTAYQPLRFLTILVPLLVAAVVLAIDPPTVLILLVTGPLVLLFLALIGSRARGITQRRFLELSWMSASFLDILQGLATLKMFGRSKEQVDNIREVSRQYGKTTMEVLRTAFETALVLELSTTIAVALVAVEISIRLVNGSLPFQHALAVLVITPEFFAPLRQLSLRYHAGAAGKAAAERIFRILDTPSPRREEGMRAIPATASLRADIRFDAVSFSYEDGQRPALDGLSLTIPHSRTIALVGATGAGKTTVANLLLRFIEPDNGSITVDGVPLASIEPAVWRSQLAWVPQRPHLFDGTVAQNIALGRPSATAEEIRDAAEAANARTFIDALPQGYDTGIGERGGLLSGGEQQRIAIARAFLKDAPFLVLDEPTSHLDSESEALIGEALRRLMRNRTVLIIAHRLSLAYAADEVVLIRAGRAVETGKHEVLMDRAGEYRKLVTAYESGAL